MMRQIREARVRAMGVNMHAKRPALPMVVVVDGGEVWFVDVVLAS